MSASCICKAQFCYVCATPWKHCECKLFAHDMIDDILVQRTMLRAERALARYEKHLGQTLAWTDLRPRKEKLAEIRAVIETGCDHSFWRRVFTSKHEPGHCRLCNYVGRKFIFKCWDCPLTTCWECHSNKPPTFRRVEPQADAAN